MVQVETGKAREVQKFCPVSCPVNITIYLRLFTFRSKLCYALSIT